MLQFTLKLCLLLFNKLQYQGFLSSLHFCLTPTSIFTAEITAPTPSFSEPPELLQLQDEATKTTGRADRGEQVGGEQVFPPPEGSTVKPPPRPHHSHSSRDEAGISNNEASAQLPLYQRSELPTQKVRAYVLRRVFVTLTPLYHKNKYNWL